MTFSEVIESESDNEPTEIVIGGKNYILEGNKIYYKNLTGLKDKLFGKYLNGKVIKNKPKEFDV